MLLRLPRDGGTVRAYLYPNLDSTIWTGTGTSIERVLDFDPEGGVLAIVDAKGNPVRIDLHLGEATIASRAKLLSLTSTNGTDIYGVDAKGDVDRLTSSGDWTFTPPTPARAVFPETDGSLVVAAQRSGDLVVWRIHPPESRILDTTSLQLTHRGTRAQVGDRLYFGTDTGLVGVKTRDLSIVPPIRFKDRVIAIAPTPSGDRLYVATAGGQGVSVVDRYTNKVSEEVALPGHVSDLRMDPLGRYVIVRPERGDSAWVIAIGTDRLVGSIETRWTGDLPTCAPDGAIAINTGRDVVFVDGETLQPVRTVVGGAKDFWYFMFWNGFRSRAAGLDHPVSFARHDTTADSSMNKDTLRDTTAAATAHDSLALAVTPPAAPTIHPAPSATNVTKSPAATAALQTFSVSFAALLNEQKARELANGIVVNGIKARVAPVQRAGTMVYRVILGPFPSHDAAENAGQASQRSFWVYPDEP